MNATCPGDNREQGHIQQHVPYRILQFTLQEPAFCRAYVHKKNRSFPPFNLIASSYEIVVRKNIRKIMSQ